MTAWSFPWPNDSGQATNWLLLLAIGYATISVLISLARKSISKDFSFEVTTNAVTFGLSVMLLLGVSDAKIFDYIGGITVPAMTAGIAGVLFSLRGIFKRPD